LAKEGAVGNVFSYNYSLNPSGSENDIALHGHYGLMNLVEGNVVQKIIAGDWWGPSGPGNTYFRNRVETDDIVMQDATHAQNIVGNEILNGTVTITESNNTWALSNKNSSGFIDNEFSGLVASSLYLDAKPAFLDGYEWPAIGPEFSLNEHTIPAKERWENNGLNLVPCLDLGTITSSKEIVYFVKIFPNPSNGVISIVGYEGAVDVLNIHGAVITTQNSESVNLTGISKGVYFIRIQEVGVFQKIVLH
jgi:hypothetical protein